MKTIYRIEAITGEGMYRCRSALVSFKDACDIMPIDEAKHPTPRNDSLLIMNMEASGLDTNSEDVYEYRFGFSSLEQLRNWIYRDSWLIGLHDIGLVITEYCCEDKDVLVGHTQAIFKGSLYRKSYSIKKYFYL